MKKEEKKFKFSFTNDNKEKKLFYKNICGEDCCKTKEIENKQKSISLQNKIKIS